MRARLLATAAFVAACALAIDGQAPVPGPAPRTPPRDAAVSQQGGTGVIRGRVVRADTGAPLRRVRIRVSSFTSENSPASTMTDDEGRYELTELSGGRYQLTATKGGYVEIAYGQRRPFEEGRPIELRSGQVVEGIDFAMPIGAVVSGRILDEAGEPVAHAGVALARYRYVEGTRRVTTSQGAQTDDRGEFRIFGVAPGDYFVVARFGESEIGARDRTRYVRTYYPGTPAVAEAQRLTIGLGQEISGVTFALARATAAAIRGVLRTADGSPLPLFAFVAAQAVDEPPGDSDVATAVAGRDGSFTVGGLLPGRYELSATVQPADTFASAEVVVDNADVVNVVLMLSRGSTARGRIRFDTGGPPRDLPPARIFVVPQLLGRRVSGSFEMPPGVRDDWSFELRGLSGRGFVRAGSLSDWQMKTVHLNGADVTDTPLDFSNGGVEGLEIVMTRRHTAVSGIVTDDRGATAIDGTVVLFADDRERWGQHSRFIASARPNQQGRFTVQGLPPGRYLAIAVDYVEPGAERDPELLEMWRARAESLSLAEGETRALDLTLSAF